MTVQSDLTATFAERELTVPVSLVGTGAATRAFFDRRGSVRSVGGFGVEAEQDTLTIQRGTLPGAAQEQQVVVGPVGADTADLNLGGVMYKIASSPQRIEDGELETLTLVGGADS